MRKPILFVGSLACLLVSACDDTTGTGGAGGAGTTGSTSSKTGSTSAMMTTSSTTSASTTDASSSSSSSSGGGCVVLDPGMLLQSGDEGEFLYTLPTLADPALPDEFDINFYGAPYTPAVGTYDLTSTGINDNYATCSECIFVYQDVDNMDIEDKFFFQSEGTLTITETDPVKPNISAGSLTNVKLVESTVDANFFSTPVVGGACYIIPSLTWDTTTP